MNPELAEIAQEVILDHATRPRNFGAIAGAICVRSENSSCGDEIDLHVKFAPDASIEEIKFTGHGCAISQASASLLTMKMKGVSQTEARALSDAFRASLTTEVADPPRMLGDLRLLQGVREFPQRARCALLAWQALDQAFREFEERSKEAD